MDELDSYLKQLSKLAKQHSPGSKRRIIAVTRLLAAIENSGKLYCQGKYDYPPEVYHEAIQAVRTYVFRSIDRYDPTRAKMMTWINQKLNLEFKGAINKFKQERQLEVSLSSQSGTSSSNFNRDLDTLSSEQTPFLSESVRQLIEEDLEDVFKNQFIRGRPEVNFQAIALHLLDGYGKRELADMWNIPEQTLYSFFRRSCQKFKLLFEKYLRE
ncbi:MAG: hypothetical protein F6J96_09080 [Symploca sp. SIO1C2]|nr:hypothetical protein [Symploca sp. SIO1C2]